MKPLLSILMLIIMQSVHPVMSLWGAEPSTLPKLRTVHFTIQIQARYKLIDPPADTFAWITKANGRTNFAARDVADEPNEVRLDAEPGKRSPQSVIVLPGDKFLIKNLSPIGLAPRSFAMHTNWSSLVPANSELAFPIDKPESIPFRVECVLHPGEALGYVLAPPSHHAALLKSDRKITFRDAPTGNFYLAIWHPDYPTLAPQFIENPAANNDLALELVFVPRNKTSK